MAAIEPRKASEHPALAVPSPDDLIPVVDTSAAGEVHPDFPGRGPAGTLSRVPVSGILALVPPADLSGIEAEVDALESDLAGLQSAHAAHAARSDNPHAVTAAQVGAYSTTQVDAAIAGLSAVYQPLGSYADAVHTHVIADTAGLQAALDGKAPLASPALTGTPTAPTATAGTATTQLATTAFAAGAVADHAAAADPHTPYVRADGTRAFTGSPSAPGSGTNSERYGSGATATGTDSFAAGKGATTAGTRTVAIGHLASCTETGGTGSVAIGRGASTNGSANVAIGPSVAITGSSAVLIGAGSSVTNGVVVVGSACTASNFKAIALGLSCVASHVNSAAIGANLATTRENELVLGGGQGNGAGSTTIGHRIRVRGQDSASTLRDIGLVDFRWLVSTSASRLGAVVLVAADWTGTNRDTIQVWSDGSSGRAALPAPASAPTDAHLAVSQITPYLDESGDNVYLRVRKSDGTYFTAGPIPKVP